MQNSVYTMFNKKQKMQFKTKPCFVKTVFFLQKLKYCKSNIPEESLQISTVCINILISHSIRQNKTLQNHP